MSIWYLVCSMPCSRTMLRGNYSNALLILKHHNSMTYEEIQYTLQSISIQNMLLFRMETWDCTLIWPLTSSIHGIQCHYRKNKISLKVILTQLEPNSEFKNGGSCKYKWNSLITQRVAKIHSSKTFNLNATVIKRKLFHDFKPSSDVLIVYSFFIIGPDSLHAEMVCWFTWTVIILHLISAAQRSHWHPAESTRASLSSVV